MSLVTLALAAGATRAPVYIDLTPIVVASLSLLGLLASGGVLLNRLQRHKLSAEAKLTEAQIPLTHAQYESFIAEAAQRLQSISELAITRLERELANANRRISDLEVELERVKVDKDRITTEAEAEATRLTSEIGRLRTRVAELERRLERRRH